MALAVDEGLIFLNALTDGMDHGEAFAVTSDSESSIEVKSRRSTTRSTRSRCRPIPSPSPSQLPPCSPSRPPQRCPPRSSSQRGGRRDRNRDDHEKEEKSTCWHCKLFGRNQAHPNVSESKCNWNKKSKCWRPEWVAKKMGLPYVQPDHFGKAHGG